MLSFLTRHRQAHTSGHLGGLLRIFSAFLCNYKLIRYFIYKYLHSHNKPTCKSVITKRNLAKKILCIISALKKKLKHYCSCTVLDVFFSHYPLQVISDIKFPFNKSRRQIYIVVFAREAECTHSQVF